MYVHLLTDAKSIERDGRFYANVKKAASTPMILCSTTVLYNGLIRVNLSWVFA